MIKRSILFGLMVLAGCSNDSSFLVFEDLSGDADDAAPRDADTNALPDEGPFDASDAPDTRTIAADALPDTTTTDSAPLRKRIFVTSEIYTGNLGGLVGADAKCQALADAAKLGGTFRAWLSDATTHAKDRLVHSTVPYTLVDGTKIAADWPDLIAGGLASAINLTEKKTAAVAGDVGPCGDGSAGVRTATSPTGVYKGPSDCSGWTNGTTLAPYSAIGCAGRKDAGWTEGAGTEVCLHTAPIYCLEQ